MTSGHRQHSDASAGEVVLHVPLSTMLMPAQMVFTDQYGLHVNILCLCLEHTSQLVQIKLSMSGLAVQPVVPALDIIVHSY